MSVDTSALTNALNASLGALTLGGVLSSVLILLVCLAAIRVVLALVGRVLARTRLEERVSRYIVTAVKGALYLLAALIVADSLGVPVTSLIALVSVFGLAVSLAVQDVLADVAGGLVILFSKPFSLGDYIATDDGEGTVAEISLTHTKLDTYDGLRVMLPNSKLVAGKIVNHTVRGVRRVSHTVSVSYESAVADVRRACLQAVGRTAGVLADPAPVVLVSKYGERSVEYAVRFWTHTDDYWDAFAASLEELRRSFEESGVEMTCNHLNVHILDKTNEK